MASKGLNVNQISKVTRDNFPQLVNFMSNPFKASGLNMNQALPRGGGHQRLDGVYNRKCAPCSRTINNFKNKT